MRFAPHCIPLAVMLCLASSPAGADQPGNAAQPASAIHPQHGVPSSTEPMDFPLERRIDVVFKGGHVGEYIEAIQKAAEARCIVAFLPDEPLRVPPIELRGVTLRSAIEAINNFHAEAANGQWFIIQASSGNEYAQVRAQPAPPPSATRRPDPVTTKIWTIDELIRSGYKSEDILSAVESCLAIHGEKAPAISFHKDTNLLMARGTSEQCEVIEGVFKNLEQAAKAAGTLKDANALSDKVVELTGQLASARDAITALNQRIAQLQEQLVEEHQRSAQLGLELAQMRREQGKDQDAAPR